MPRRSVLLAALSAVVVAAAAGAVFALAQPSTASPALSDDATPATSDTVLPGSDVADGPGSLPKADASPGQGPGVAEGEPDPNGVETVGEREPAYDCRDIDGETICDTFDERDEGPGTTGEPDQPVSSDAS